MGQSAPETGQDRAELRHARSVLTEAFLQSRTGNIRHFGNGIVTEMWESGLALRLDELPKSDNLLLRNRYFEVACRISYRERRREGGHEIVVRFSSPVIWKEQEPLPPKSNSEGTRHPRSPKSSSEARPARVEQLSYLGRLIAATHRKLGFDTKAFKSRFAVYTNSGDHANEDLLSLSGRPVLAKCRKCGQRPCCWKLVNKTRIPLNVCKHCLIEVAPFKAFDDSLS